MRMRESMIADVPLEAVGVWLSHNTGYDMSQLPSRFSLAELQQRIVAANASPVGFVHLLAKKYGENTEIIARGILRARPARGDRLQHHLRRHGIRNSPTGWKRCSRPPAAAAASCCRFPRRPHATVLQNIVNYLVPELQRRDRYRTSYEGKTLRENMSA